MTKNFLLMLIGVISFSLISCKSAKYPNLGNGIFADIQTNKGDMVVKLNYKKTPVTVANFISLAEGTNHFVADSLKGKAFYNGTIFHRVIKDFMIQGGDPTGTGMGSPGYQFEDEIVDSLVHDKKGVMSMANSGPNTNGSQFFITQVPTPWLNGRHTVFGEVVEGLNVVDSIASAETGANDKPVKDIVINSIKIIRNGKEAKSFNAEEVFSNYMKERTEKEHQKEEKMKVQIEKMSSEFDKQQEEAKKLPSGIKIYMLQKGNGRKPKNNEFALVKYAGYLSDGKLFDSNEKEVAEAYGMYDPNRDAQGGYRAFPMPYNKSAQLIPGFKEALLTLKEGDKVRVFIPASLGYGERGAGNVIPPNSDLVFDIAIEGIQDTPEMKK